MDPGNTLIGNSSSSYIDMSQANPMVVGFQTPAITLFPDSSTEAIKTQFNKKTGYAAGVQIDQPDQFASKQYVDNAVVVGGSLTQQQADARYYLNSIKLNQIQAPDASLSLNSQTITNLSNPASAQDASTKAYVDEKVDSATQITAGSNKLLADSSLGIRFQKGGADQQVVDQASGAISVNTKNNSAFQIFADNIALGQTSFAMAGISGSSTLPQYQIVSQVDGTNGRICRISASNKADATKVASFELQADAKHLVVNTGTVLAYQDAARTIAQAGEITSKSYVDAQVSSASRIINSAQTIEVKCNASNATITNTAGTGDFLVLSNNEVRVDSGTVINLARGTTQLQLFDNGTDSYGQLNKRLQYQSGQVTGIANQDVLLSQRLADTRYHRPGQSLAMGSTKITGLADATATGDAIHFGQLLALMRSLGMRRQAAFSFYVGDLPLNNNVSLNQANFSRDSQITAMTVTHYVGAAVNYFRVYCTHTFGHANLQFFSQVYSTRSNPSTGDNDQFVAPWLSTISISSTDFQFDACYEPNGGDQAVQMLGLYLTAVERQ